LHDFKPKKKEEVTSKRFLLCKSAINCDLIQDFQTIKRIQRRDRCHAKKFVKGLPMKMVVVLAIVVQAPVQAENPSFSHPSLNHLSPLTPFPHSALIISLYISM
jgi:hypothetical protein